MSCRWCIAGRRGVKARGCTWHALPALRCATRGATLLSTLRVQPALPDLRRVGANQAKVILVRLNPGGVVSNVAPRAAQRNAGSACQVYPRPNSLEASARAEGVALA